MRDLERLDYRSGGVRGPSQHRLIPEGPRLQPLKGRASKKVPSNKKGLRRNRGSPVVDFMSVEPHPCVRCLTQPPRRSCDEVHNSNLRLGTRYARGDRALRAATEPVRTPKGSIQDAESPCCVRTTCTRAANMVCTSDREAALRTTPLGIVLTLLPLSAYHGPARRAG